MADEEFKLGNTDRPEAFIDLEEFEKSIPSGYMDYGLEARLWEEFAPEFGGFDPNDPDFQAAMDELITSGLSNIATGDAKVDKQAILKYILSSLETIDITDGVSQEEIDEVVAFLATGLVSIDDVAKTVGLPADVVSAAYEANKPAVDDSVGEWYDPDTGLVIPDFDPATGKGMGTLFPIFYPDVTQTSSGGAAASSDAASSAASSDAASSAASSDAASSAASSDAASSDAASSDSAAQAATDAAAAASVTGGESITWDDLFGYLMDTPRELTDEEIAANQAAAAEQKALEDKQGDFVARQIYEAATAETDPALKAALIREYYQYRNLPIPAEAATEIAELEAEAKAKATGDPTQIGGNTVFTTDTSGLSDDAVDVTLGANQDITIIDTGNGTPAVDGDTKILTKEEKDAAFNEVLAGVNENTAIADVIAAAVEIYGDTADAVVAVANAANSAGVSAEDLANATGTSIEDINKAAEEANVVITNQETAAAAKAAADKAAADKAAADKAAADKAAADKAAADAAAAAKAACDAAGGNIVNGECVCPTGYSKVDGKCVADGDGDGDDDDDDDEGGCTGGKIDDGFGNCVCPEGKVEIDGVCQDAGGGGGCTGGKIDDGFGNCVCPEGKVEIDGVCQDAP